MPILAVDQMGRIYSTSPDREDGLGYGSSPECVGQSDLTLGNAYLKAQDARREANVRAYRQQRMLDAQDEANAQAKAQSRALQAREEAAHAEMYENRDLMEQVAVAAIGQNQNGMGCACEYSTALSGNVMTANGQSGWAGMSRDQQVLHNAVSGMGRNTSYAVDRDEAEQRAHQMEAERILRLQARR